MNIIKQSSYLFRFFLFIIVLIVTNGIIIYVGWHTALFLKSKDVPFADLFMRKPGFLPVLLISGIFLFIYYYKYKPKMFVNLELLEKTITKKLDHILTLDYVKRNIFTKLKITQAYISCTYKVNPDVTIKFYDSKYIDVHIKNVFGNYFSLRIKDVSTLKFNLLGVTDNTTDISFIKRMFHTRPRRLESREVKIIMEIIDLFSCFYSLKLDETGLRLSDKRKIDVKNWRDVENSIKEVDPILEVLTKNKVYKAPV